MKALLHYRASPGFRKRLEQVSGAISMAIVDEEDEEGFAREISDTDALLHVLKPVTAEMMASAPRLKLIQKIGVGVNTIDLASAEAAGIAVANMPGTNSQAVAEATLMLILSVLRRASYLDPLTRRGEGWRADPDLMDGVAELAGRTIGFFGFGLVPAKLAPALAALGAEIIYTARSPKAGMEEAFVSFDELLRRSDILSLHAPLTAETDGIFSETAIRRMKPGSILINTARGGLVDEPALIEALESGHLRGAGLDVFAKEPVDPGNPLLRLSTVTLMPHVAWLTPETLERSLGIALENCRRVMAGEPLLHRVI